MIRRRKLAALLERPDLPDQARVELRKVLDNNKVVLPGWSPSFLRRIGRMDTVIDVGVLEGTPALYQAFPDARLVLVEALPGYRQKCLQLLAAHPGGGEVHMCAVGAEDGSATIRYYPDRPATSSLLETEDGGHGEPVRIDVPLRRLDGLVKPDSLAGNALLKIDVEGMELEVLKGAVGLLPHIRCIIAETSIRKRHRDSYRFADVVAFLASHGLHLYDALRVTRRKAMRPGASIMDAIFINESVQ